MTLRLEPRPGAGEGLSFAFDEFPGLVGAIEAVSRFGLVTEVFGAETALMRLAAGRAALKQDASKLLAIMRGASGPVQALRTGLRVALGGRRFLNTAKYLVHFLAEGADAGELRMVPSADTQGRSAAAASKSPTPWRSMRARSPFPDPMIVGHSGRRLLPLHAIVPFSNAVGLHEEYLQYLADMREECEREGRGTRTWCTASAARPRFSGRS